ncbi:MAG: RNA polymerase sigma factor [Clostridia bacterium]|nr:RNA polymerase sigma factor [Clostridia bacterium]
MNGQEIKSLIKKAKHGDSRSFGLLYGEYAKELYRFALYTLKSTCDAEDAVQSAALIAYRKLKDLKKDESFKSWFFKILYNECRKILSQKNKLYEISYDDVSVFQEEAPDISEKSDLISLLDTLSEENKAIVILSVFEGYTSKEIAEILGMKPGTVRSTLSRTLNKLRNQLEGAKNV